MMSILITGFNGNVGFAVGHALKNEKIPFYAGVQDPARIPENLKKDYTFRTLDYNEPATFSTALEGCNQLFLLYPPQVSLEAFQRFIHFLSFSKIQHIVYLSVKDVQFLPFIPHYKNEALIRKAGIPYTFIRAGYFMQNLNLFMREEIKQNQQIFVPAGKGKSSFTDIRDIATIVLHSLVSLKLHQDQAHTITGEESLDFYEAASLMTLLLEKPIHYTNPSIHTFKMRMSQKGLPEDHVNVVANLHIPTKLGLAGGMTTTFYDLSRNRPIRMEQYIRDYAHHWKA